jgi:hemerythrin-like domain-containing protein
MQRDRREFLAETMTLGIFGCVATAADAQDSDQAKLPAGDRSREPSAEGTISAAEDLMREHGVLNRILLIYEEGLRRLQAGEEATPEMFQHPAALVRKFVEDYHERLEERFVFPEFEKRRELPNLTGVLRQQHAAGRGLTDQILRNAAPDRFRQSAARRELSAACTTFIRMYRPHEAREDTVLFPALHKLLSAQKLKDLGEQFEAEEDRLFGEEGFEKTVNEVAQLEKQLGIYDLAQFTPWR